MSELSMKMLDELEAIASAAQRWMGPAPGPWRARLKDVADLLGRDDPDGSDNTVVEFADPNDPDDPDREFPVARVCALFDEKGHIARHISALSPTVAIELIRRARECDRLVTENTSLSDDVDLEMGIAVTALEDYAHLTDDLTEERLKAQVDLQRVRDERADAIATMRLKCTTEISKVQIAAKCEARTLRIALGEVLDELEATIAPTKHAWIDERRKLVTP